jgi:DNA polymerase III subunit gamma/tau
MTYQVLARKWRPRSFEGIVGQSHVVTALANALDSKRLHHAYLFTGTRGVGKTTLARILAKAVNCETAGISSHPCGKCNACVQIDAGRFIDLLEVDAATNTKVDEMRELLDTAQYMPVAGRFKVYIIDEVHMLSKHAFNSMLKTLEEPPEHVKFILATTDPQRLPVTVLSRCLQFNLKPLPPAALAAHLEHVLDAEGIPHEAAALVLLSKAAQGSVRDSLSLTDQAIAHGAGKITTASVAEMLGSVGGDLVWPLLERVAVGDGAGALAECDRLAERSLSLDQALEDIAAILHRVAVVQHGGEIAADDPDRERLAALASNLDAPRVQVMYQVAVLGRRDLALAPDEFAGFSMTVMRMLSFAAQGAARTIAARPAAAVKVVSAPAAVNVEPARAAVKVASAPAAPAPAAQAAPAPVRFDGDWPAFVERLNLTGMAGLVARHGEFVSFNGNHLELVVPEAQKAYAEKNYQDKLRAELLAHLGAGLRLTVRVGETLGKSVAVAKSIENERRIAGTAAAMEEDPFVKDLVRDLGAQVVPSSIRPADAAADAADERGGKP